MKRILLFLATNLAVVVLLGIILRLIGFEGILDARGVDLNLGALLVFLLLQRHYVRGLLQGGVKG